MSAAHWELVYGRPPVSRDAALFGIALALHLPLFFMQFKGVVRSKDPTIPFVEIRERDAAIDRILQRGIILPPKVPLPDMKIDLSGLIKPHSIQPVLSSPSGKGIRPAVTEVLPVLASLHTAPPPPVISAGEINVAKKADRGRFLMASGTVGTIEPPISIAGRPSKMVNIPTGQLAQPDAGIKSPPARTSKIHMAPLLPEGPAPVVRSTLKVDARAGAPIAVGKPPLEEPTEIPVIRAKPRTLTEAERKKELFPIHGALKDRPVDHQEIPEYPEWARKRGIESSVQFQFSVTADGRVKDTIEVVKGTGYPELDELARRALLRWIFSPLPPEKGNLVQDGIIEFRFSIK